MEEQTQNSENLKIPSRWRRFSAYLLDLFINIILWGVIPYIVFILTDGNIVSVIIGLILLIFEIILIIFERNTTGNELVGIFALNKEDNTISKGQSILRFFVFNPAFLPLILILIWFLISLMFYLINGGCYYAVIRLDGSVIQNQNPICNVVMYDTNGSIIQNQDSIRNIINRLGISGLIFLLISIIEIFFKCPTFIDKRLGIKRFYKKSKNNE